MKRLLQYPWFLVLLPLFIVVHIESEYHHMINYRFVYREIITLFLTAPVIYGICLLITRSYLITNILSFAMLSVFYFFGELKDWLKRMWTPNFWQSYLFLLPLIFILTVVIIYLVVKKKAGKFPFVYIHTALLLFIIADIVDIIYQDTSKKNDQPLTVQSLMPSASLSQPDIYYLIFDSYTSSGVLKDSFYYNNSDIESFLAQRGFKIMSKSRSNYNRTPFSIQSTFNMEYLPRSFTTKEYLLKNYLAGINTLYNCQLFSLMEKQGYDIFNHSIFEFKSHPSTITPFDIWDVNALYERHSLIKKLDADVGWKFPKWARFFSGEEKFLDYAIKRDKHDSAAVSYILHTARMHSGKPKFVYGHLFQPHYPYTMDSIGNRHDPSPYLTMPEDKRAYVQQVIYSNKIIKQLVDTILANRQRPVVIIIQGDHGYRRFGAAAIEMEFPNFNVMYFSNGDYHLLNDSTSNVNTFRVVFNTFFWTKATVA